MIRGNVTYYPQTGKPAIAVTIGIGEDVKAPRHLAALEKSGWVIDEGVALTFKAFLAGKRQGDIEPDVDFSDWIDTVEDLDVRPSAKQIREAVALGSMTEEQAERMLALIGDSEGEANAPLA